jgi:aerobic C4-dicarboxylate transport protein
MKKLFSNLTFWVLIAITTGILIGHLAPKVALYPVLQKPWKVNVIGLELSVGTTLSEFLSGIFISIVKIFIIPIIFLTISLGISGMGNLKKVGRVGGKALIYFEIVTTIALLVGIIVAWVIQPGAGVNTKAISGGDITRYTNASHNFSWLKFLKDNLTIQVLLFSIVFGIFLSKYNRREKIMNALTIGSKNIFKGLHLVMYFAPIGAFGGMAFTIAKYGIDTLLPLGKLMITVYCTMAVFIFVILGFILRMYKISIWKFLKYIKEELLIVLGTSSSEAALPSLMEKLEGMGCSKPVVGLVVPAGYSFNLDGTTIYLSMAVLFLAQVFNIDLSWGQIFTIIGILMVTSKGAAGVTGSGFVVLASTLTAVKARAITNFIGNGFATVFLANNEKEFDREKMNAVFNDKEN